MKSSFSFECETSESQAIAAAIKAAIDGEVTHTTQIHHEQLATIDSQTREKGINTIFKIAEPIIPFILNFLKQKNGLDDCDKILKIIKEALLRIEPVLLDLDKRISKLEGKDVDEETDDEDEDKDKEPETTKSENPS